MAATDPATHRQLAYIKELAYSRGVSFIPPANRVAGQPTDRPAQAAARARRASRSPPTATQTTALPRRARTRQLTP